jgi:serine/threonine protein kinase
LFIFYFFFLFVISKYSPPEILKDGKYDNDNNINNLILLFFLFRRSFASDVWAAGVCMYEVITLQFPFNDLSFYNLMDEIINKEIKEIESSYRINELKNLIIKMLIKV